MTRLYPFMAWQYVSCVICVKGLQVFVAGSIGGGFVADWGVKVVCYGWWWLEELMVLDTCGMVTVLGLCVLWLVVCGGCFIVLFGWSYKWWLYVGLLVAGVFCVGGVVCGDVVLGCGLVLGVSGCECAVMLAVAGCAFDVWCVSADGDGLFVLWVVGAIGVVDVSCGGLWWMRALNVVLCVKWGDVVFCFILCGGVWGGCVKLVFDVLLCVVLLGVGAGEWCWCWGALLGWDAVVVLIWYCVVCVVYGICCVGLCVVDVVAAGVGSGVGGVYRCVVDVVDGVCGLVFCWGVVCCVWVDVNGVVWLDLVLGRCGGGVWMVCGVSRVIGVGVVMCTVVGGVVVRVCVFGLMFVEMVSVVVMIVGLQCVGGVVEKLGVCDGIVYGGCVAVCCRMVVDVWLLGRSVVLWFSGVFEWGLFVVVYKVYTVVVCCVWCVARDGICVCVLTGGIGLFGVVVIGDCWFAGGERGGGLECGVYGVVRLLFVVCGPWCVVVDVGVVYGHELLVVDVVVVCVGYCMWLYVCECGWDGVGVVLCVCDRGVNWGMCVVMVVMMCCGVVGVVLWCCYAV
ncbi:hypothetical protein Tco_0138983 [Tanacetum coccineum]